MNADAINFPLRDLTIATAVLNGAGMTKLARKHGVTATRISQITRKFCFVANKPVYMLMSTGCCGGIVWLRANKRKFLGVSP